jgi:hypothetical protein
MTFSADLLDFARKLKLRNQRVFLTSVTEVDRSIRVGSPLTGAPGQPVDTGALRNSWETTFPTKSTAEVSTAQNYAPYIEDGAGMQLRSKVGGFHSVKLTRAGWQRIVDAMVQQETAND